MMDSSFNQLTFPVTRRIRPCRSSICHLIIWMSRFAWQPEMFDKIHIEIHWRIQTHQKVSDMRYRFNPMWPLSFILTRKSQEFVNVGDPLDGMTKYENQDDSQTDFGQSNFISLVLISMSNWHIVLENHILVTKTIRIRIRLPWWSSSSKLPRSILSKPKMELNP